MKTWLVAFAAALTSLTGAGAAVAAPNMDLECHGAFTQGGLILCRTSPFAKVTLDGIYRGDADSAGWFVAGFDRDAPAEAVLLVQQRDGPGVVGQAIVVKPRQFDVQRVDGLPPSTVTPTDPAVLERIESEKIVKAQGLASRAAIEGFLGGIVQPVQGIVTGRWGNQRVLNGVPKTPHYGFDIAAPIGTPIEAAGEGVVSLAEPDLHFEGGLVLIDHGQGLITMYLHMDRLDVTAGQHVRQGEIIGAVGAKGRATGPHLCWRMKWRDRQLDPELAVAALADARVAFGLSEAAPTPVAASDDAPKTIAPALP